MSAGGCRLCLSTSSRVELSPLEASIGLVASTLALDPGPLQAQPSGLCSPCRTTMQDFKAFKEMVTENIQFIVKNKVTIMEQGLEWAKSDLLKTKEESATDEWDDDVGESFVGENFDQGPENSDNSDNDDPNDKNWTALENQDMKELATPISSKIKVKPRKPGFCDSCQREYSDIVSHRSHFHNRKLSTCNDCGKVFNGKHLLRQHAKRMHKETVETHERAYEENTILSPKEEAMEDVADDVQNNIDDDADINFESDGDHEIKPESDIEEVFKIKKKRSNGAKPGFCDFCQRDYTDLASHKSHFHNREVVTCPECGKVFNGKHLLRGHMKRHTNQLVPCPECGKMVKESYLQKHIKFVHKEAADIQCTYPDCTKLFNQPQTLDNHIKSVHLKQTTLCTNCGQNVSNLYNHKQTCCPTEFDIADRTCKICQKMFTTSNSRRIHEKMHGQKACTSCTICGKVVSLMEKHLRNMHSNDDKLEFECSDESCGKAFKTKPQLKTHMDNVHLKLRDECPECGQWFSLSHLKSHIRNVHSGKLQRRHPCTEV